MRKATLAFTLLAALLLQQATEAKKMGRQFQVLADLGPSSDGGYSYLSIGFTTLEGASFTVLLQCYSTYSGTAIDLPEGMTDVFAQNANGAGGSYDACIAQVGSNIEITASGPAGDATAVIPNMTLPIMPRPQMFLEMVIPNAAAHSEIGAVSIEIDGITRPYDWSNTLDWNSVVLPVSGGRIVGDGGAGTATYAANYYPLHTRHGLIIPAAGFPRYEYRHQYWPALGYLSLVEWKDDGAGMAAVGSVEGFQYFYEYGGCAAWEASDGTRWLASSRKRLAGHPYRLEVIRATGGTTPVFIAEPAWSPCVLRLQPSDSVMVAWIDASGNIMVNILDPATAFAPYVLRGAALDTGYDGIGLAGMWLAANGKVALAYVNADGQTHTAYHDTSGGVVPDP